MSVPSGVAYPDGDRTLLTCPACGQAARVDLHGDRLAVHCFAQCPPEKTLAAVGSEQLSAEFRRDESTYSGKTNGSGARSSGALPVRPAETCRGSARSSGCGVVAFPSAISRSCSVPRESAKGC